jgi:hypothetical protein
VAAGVTVRSPAFWSADRGNAHAAVDDGLILNPAKKKRTVDPPRSSQVRAQKQDIVTWTGRQLHAF